MKEYIVGILKRFVFTLRGECDLDTLKNRGLIVGKNFRMMTECRIDHSHCWHITIGDNVTFAPRVHVLAHDASTDIHLGFTKVGNVRIGNNVFVGAGTIILPGVHIGDDCIIGAGSVISRSIDAGHVAAGNPARIITTTAAYLTKQSARMTAENCLDESFTMRAGITMQQKFHMIKKVEEQGLVFVK